ncbi:MAG: alkaline phosphatase family protein [Desulfosporosinus sp.]|nr:alkaline phosphatase family protein [Desulfosporosinus sp.]
MKLMKGADHEKGNLICGRLLHPSVLGRILSEGNAPAFRFLVKHGTCIDRVISSFPTMTPVATSSMITGTWPNQHGVPGFIWYNEQIRKIVDYGATWQSILKIGLEKVLRNLLLNLNEDHLNTKTPTLYEELEAGGYSTGNVNFFMHRARHTYLAKVPFTLAFGTGFRLNREDVSGPSHLTLGQLIHPLSQEGQEPIREGPFIALVLMIPFLGKLRHNLSENDNNLISWLFTFRIMINIHTNMALCARGFPLSMQTNKWHQS